MKSILIVRCTIFLFTLCMLFANDGVLAQTVFVPDTNMRAWLNSYGPGCVDANGWFDPTHPEIVNDTIFALVLGDGWDVTGIEALPNARQLAIGGPSGGVAQSEILAWPDSLRKLRIEYYGSLQHVGGLPDCLERIEFDMTGIATIDSWPSSLKELFVTQCPAAQIPPFPAGLRSLSLESMDNLENVPQVGTQVRYFRVFGCELLNTLPMLPPTVEDLWLQSLPLVQTWPVASAWPDSLKYLQLWSMDVPGPSPALPLPLELLVLDDLEGMTSLPEFNEHLYSLSLMDCPLLGGLPSRFPQALHTFEILNCPLIQCLPWLHDSMYLYLEFAAVDCLPNVPANDFTVNPSYLLSRPCAIYGPECTVPGISGETYLDGDADGLHDAGEPAYAYATIELEPGAILCSSDSSGHFEIGPGPGSYQIVPAAAPYLSSVLPSEHSAMLSTSSEMDSLNDFGYTLIEGAQDLRIDFYRMSARSGFARPAWLTVKNMGSVPMTATAVLTLDMLDQFVSSEVAPSSIDGQVLTWNFPEIPPGMIRVVELSLIVPAGTPFGLPMVHHASVFPLIGDLMPDDNSIAVTYTTINGMDPNDKLVTPEELTPSEVLSTERLTYTINFQNTGNYQADRVVITDTLSDDLQSHTIEFLSSSHAVTWSLVDDVLVFTFNNIFLPDSTADEQGSHGFVRFTIRPVADLQLGEQVSNVANIYFDFNEPVVTAPALVTIVEPDGIDAHMLPTLEVFPDPAEEWLIIRCEPVYKPFEWEICDISGKRTLSGNLTGTTSQIDVSRLQPGAYVLHVKNTDGAPSMRFLKR